MTNKTLKARFAGKTVLSGGPHPTEDPDVGSGNREKIEIGDGNASVKMKIKEDADEEITVDLDEGRALTVAQRLQRSRAIRRIKPRLQRAARRSLVQAPSQSRLWKRSQRAARNVLKKRFSPVKGVSYNKLSTTQKIFVDRALEKRQKLIRRVAKRLLPKVRMASFKRLQSYRMGTSRNRLRENENFELAFNQKPLPQIIESMIVNMGDHPMADSLMTLLNLTAKKDSPAVKSLKEKAASINAPFAEILQVYADALLEYKKTGMKLTAEQYAFNAVNAYVADRKAPTINEKFEEMNENFAGILLGNHQNNSMFKEEAINEVVITRPHGPGKDGHHFFWKGQHGKKKFGDLKLVSRGDSPDQHHYSLLKMNGKPVLNRNDEPLSLTKKRWGEVMASHFERHDTKRTILNRLRKRSKKKKTDDDLGEVWLPSDSITDHAVEAIKTTRGNGPIKKQIANVVKTTGYYVKMSASEKLDKIKTELAQRRKK